MEVYLRLTWASHKSFKSIKYRENGGCYEFFYICLRYIQGV